MPGVWPTSPGRSRATRRAAPRSSPNAGLLDVPGLRIWVGYLDDRPVACGGARHRGLRRCRVRRDPCRRARGRGFGAAVTWHATLADPDKPGVLIASDAGQAVYERMGYVRLMRLTMWAAAPTAS